MATRPRDGQHDFDFLFGRWQARNRRLVGPLSGSIEWVEFDGTITARPLWGGAANIDEYQGDAPDGRIDGLTLRIYNPASGQWTLHWANRSRGVLDKPMTGEFRDGRGEFYDQEEFQGRSIYVRYVWSGMTKTSCRWEQAFSDDGGRTWETNWVVELTRVE